MHGVDFAFLAPRPCTARTIAPATLVEGHVFDPNVLLPLAAITVQRLYLHRVGPPQFRREIPRAVLLKDGLDTLQPSRQRRRGVVRRDHLCRQHALDIVGWLGANQCCECSLQLPILCLPVGIQPERVHNLIREDIVEVIARRNKFQHFQHSRLLPVV